MRLLGSCSELRGANFRIDSATSKRENAAPLPSIRDVIARNFRLRLMKIKVAA